MNILVLNFPKALKYLLIFSGKSKLPFQTTTTFQIFCFLPFLLHPLTILIAIMCQRSQKSQLQLINPWKQYRANSRVNQKQMRILQIQYSNFQFVIIYFYTVLISLHRVNVLGADGVLYDANRSQAHLKQNGIVAMAKCNYLFGSSQGKCAWNMTKCADLWPI